MKRVSETDLVPKTERKKSENLILESTFLDGNKRLKRINSICELYPKHMQIFRPLPKISKVSKQSA